MKKIKNYIALTAIMVLCASHVQGQEFDGTIVDDSAAYCDSGRASYWSAAIPIGAIVVAAIIIATTSGGHHHGSSSSSGNGGKHGRHHGGGGGGGGRGSISFSPSHSGISPSHSGDSYYGDSYGFSRSHGHGGRSRHSRDSYDSSHSRSSNYSSYSRSYSYSSHYSH